MRPESEYQAALRLIESGINDCEIGRRLEIPRGTVRDWRVGLEARSGGRTKHWTGRQDGLRGDSCFRCSGDWFDAEAYAFLLGVYLGDGCLSLHQRGVYRLRVFCDLKYPNLVNEIAIHMVITRGHEKVGFTISPGCVEVSSYWKHWPCLFPQHGPGRKHERRIELAPWQQLIADANPKGLVRGLIQSDGNRHINHVSRRLSSGVKSYRYPRYQFTNASSDIRAIFTDALDALDIGWTRMTERDISIAKRDDVAFLDSFVGPKR